MVNLTNVVHHVVTDDSTSKPFQEKLGGEKGKLTFRRITI
jgi:hypothetical protein